MSWDAKESNRLRRKGFKFPEGRHITAGTMLAIDWKTKTIRALLKSDLSLGGLPNTKLQKDRDAMIGQMANEGQALLREDHAHGDPWQETSGELTRVRRTANLLHMAEGSPKTSVKKEIAERLRPPQGVDTSAFFALVEARQRAGSQ